MTRAAIYARYSSDNQRDASIEDQVRLCVEFVEQQGWSHNVTFADRAQSGSSHLRPGYQNVLEAARNGMVEVVVAEALDRLSRDQEHVAALFKQLTFSGVRLVTLAEGEINELHVGLKGTMNALFLKDLADKTRRGLRGRIEAGRSGGGISYGYEVVREIDGAGDPVRGKRRINDVEAANVRRIFIEFAGGRSPRAIAHGLNQDGIPGPHDRPWGPSTIYGNWRRGTGILNNELYIGRLVWNRQRFVKEPATGKRQARANPESAWIVEEVPALRVVEQGLWDKVKARQDTSRRAVASERSTCGRPERARRPRYLLSGLLACGECGGGFSKVSKDHYGCSNARNRGRTVCTNLVVIRRDTLEETVLSGLRTNLMAPDLVQEFITEYHAELNRLMADQDAGKSRKQAELAATERQIRQIIEAIKAGMFHESMKAEMDGLEARKKSLEAAIAEAPKPQPRLHPKLADIYREKVADLHVALNDESCREEAVEIIRALIDEIRLVPEHGRLGIVLRGDLAAILAFANAKKNPRLDDETGVQVTLVAGACNHRQLTLPWIAI